MKYEYILIKTDKKFADVFEYLRDSLLQLEDKSIGESGGESDGLHYGDGQYYSFGELSKLRIDLVRNEGYADLFNPSWKYYVTLRRKDFEDNHYNFLKEKIKNALDSIG